MTTSALKIKNDFGAVKGGENKHAISEAGKRARTRTFLLVLSFLLFLNVEEGGRKSNPKLENDVIRNWKMM